MDKLLAIGDAVRMKTTNRADYHNLDAIGGSALHHALRSAAHWAAAVAETKEPTPQMLLGTAVHALALGVGGVSVAPEVNARTKAGKEERDAAIAAAEASGLVLVSRETYDLARSVSDALHAHPAAAPMLLSGIAEHAITWNDATGLPCKAMIDLHVPPVAGGGYIADLKTCRDARPDAVSRMLAERGYHVQLAHYAKAYEAEYGETPAAQYLICVETEAPFGVTVCQLGTQTIAAAEMQRVECMRRITEHKERPVPTVYPDDPCVVDLPAWYRG